jgi:hypothetical protein
LRPHIYVLENALTGKDAAPTIATSGGEMAIDLKRADGGYMSVDPAAAVEQNRDTIDKIRELWEQKVAESKSVDHRADEKK